MSKHPGMYFSFQIKTAQEIPRLEKQSEKKTLYPLHTHGYDMPCSKSICINTATILLPLDQIQQNHLL